MDNAQRINRIAEAAKKRRNVIGTLETLKTATVSLETKDIDRFVVHMMRRDTGTTFSIGLGPKEIGEDREVAIQICTLLTDHLRAQKTLCEAVMLEGGQEADGTGD